MSTSEVIIGFKDTLVGWLGQEQIQTSLIIILATANVVLFLYSLVRDWRIRSRIEYLELRHKQLIDRFIDLKGSVELHSSELRRRTGDFTDEVQRD